MTRMAPWTKYVTAQRAMEPHNYLDAEIFEQERRLILGRTWQFACHSSQVGNPGDYVAFEIAGGRGRGAIELRESVGRAELPRIEVDLKLLCAGSRIQH